MAFEKKDFAFLVGMAIVVGSLLYGIMVLGEYRQASAYEMRELFASASEHQEARVIVGDLLARSPNPTSGEVREAQKAVQKVVVKEMAKSFTGQPEEK